MGRESTTVMSLQDRFSPTLNTIRNSNKAFNKDLEETNNKISALQTKQTALGDSYKKLQTNMESANNTLKDAKKAFKEMDDEVSRTNLEKAYGEYNKAKQELQEYSDEIKRTQKSLRELDEEKSRLENRAYGRGGGDTLSALSTASMGKMLGDSLSNSANVLIGSAFGDTMGSAISTAMSGALTGAAMGSVAGPLGTAIGATVGTASGLINAATQVFAAEDEAFTTYRNELVEGAFQRQAEDMSSGSALASSRQKKEVSYLHMFKDQGKTDEFLEGTLNLANTTPFFYDDLLEIGRTFKTFGYDDDQLFTQISRVADAGAVLDWDTSDMGAVAQVLGYMNQSGKASVQQIKQLQMRGVNAVGYIAEATGNDEQFVWDNLSKFDGAMLSEIISDYLGAEYLGGAQKLSETFFGLSSTMTGLQEQLQNSMGEGYNEARMIGMQDQIDWLSGDTADKEKEANRMIGEWEAELVNKKEEIAREVKDVVYNGEISVLAEDLIPEDLQDRIMELSGEYQEAAVEGNGAAVKGILAEIDTIIEMVYNVNDLVEENLDMQGSLVESVTEDLLASEDYWKNAGYTIGQQMSKGMMSAINETKWSELQQSAEATLGGDAFNLAEGIRYVPFDDYPARLHEGEMVLTAAQAREYRVQANLSNGGIKDTYIPFADSTGKPDKNEIALTHTYPQNQMDLPSHAAGIPYVPYDNYIASLHQGERVLTAREACGDSGMPPINITGNTFQVREEADIYRIAQELAREIRKAQMIT